MKCGLVLEGGAYRGLFSAGVLDVLMEHGVKFDAAVGVSAGAAFGVNYCSGQIGRALRYNQQFAGDKRYSGLYSLLTSGDLYNAEFCYHVVPIVHDVFDYHAFLNSGVPFYVVCTDVKTGCPVYHQLNDAHLHVALEWIRASASMPLVSNAVEVGGYTLLDGGMTDSIPLEFMQRQGYERNLVVLTRPLGYEKKRSRVLPWLKPLFRKYPKMYEVMATRYTRYNAQLAFIAQQERAGKCFVIRPPEPLTIGYVCNDPEKMASTHALGRATAEQILPQLLDFMA